MSTQLGIGCWALLLLGGASRVQAVRKYSQSRIPRVLAPSMASLPHSDEVHRRSKPESLETLHRPPNAQLLNALPRPTHHQLQVRSNPTRSPISWKLPPNAQQELLFFIDHIRNLEPKPLNDADMEAVSGKSYRGTSILLAVLALYKTGLANSVEDPAVYDLAGKEVKFKSPFASPMKEVAHKSYANKYVSARGELYQNFAKMESKIYERVFADNGLPVDRMPNFMLQPFLLALPAVYRNHTHKPFEGHVMTPRPNSTSRDLLAKLMGLTPTELAEKFPILASRFTDE